MSWRVIVVNSTAKLDLQLQRLVIRMGMETKKVNISEIAVLIIESTAVSMTAGLLNELTKQKVKIIFCNEKHNPYSELVPYYGAHDTSDKIRIQIAWSTDIKQAIWTEIVREKIKKQEELLEERGKKEQAERLMGYIEQLEWNDKTNREGHAAKVYFNALFGVKFSRNQDCVTNAALNYGYSIILSAINREISMNGYVTQLGLAHDSMFNPFNLGCDLMEPFRVLVDRKVYDTQWKQFEHEQKMQLVNLLNDYVIVRGQKCTMLNAIKRYVKSVFDALNNSDVSKLAFYSNEL